MNKLKTMNCDFNKKITLLVSACLVMLLFSRPAFSADPSATYDGNGAITDTATCTLQPDAYFIKVFRVWLIPSGQSAPDQTTGFASSRSNNVIFDSSGGMSVKVLKNSPTSLTSSSNTGTGTITRPADGSYSYVCVELAPQIQVKVNAKFSHAVELLTAANIYNTVSSGSTCYSTVNNIFNWGTPGPNTITTTPGSYGLTTMKLNSMSGNNALYYTTFPTSLGPTESAYLVDSSYGIASGASAGPASGAMGTINRLIGVVPVNITISPTTSTFDIAFNVTAGATIRMDTPHDPGVPASPSDPAFKPTLNLFGPGPFEMAISVQ